MTPDRFAQPPPCFKTDHVAITGLTIDCLCELVLVLVKGTKGVERDQLRVLRRSDSLLVIPTYPFLTAKR